MTSREIDSLRTLFLKCWRVRHGVRALLRWSRAKGN